MCILMLHLEFLAALDDFLERVPVSIVVVPVASRAIVNRATVSTGRTQLVNSEVVMSMKRLVQSRATVVFAADICSLKINVNHVAHAITCVY